jgi:hypothetical protein
VVEGHHKEREGKMLMKIKSRPVIAAWLLGTWCSALSRNSIRFAAKKPRPERGRTGRGCLAFRKDERRMTERPQE